MRAREVSAHTLVAAEGWLANGLHGSLTLAACHARSGKRVDQFSVCSETSLN